MEMFGNWAAYLFVGSIVLPMGLGIFLIIHAQRSKRKALQSQSWPVTKGIITESTITTMEDEEDGTTYLPVIRYAYEVGGMIYDGKRVVFGGDIEFNTHQKAAEFLVAYPVDQEVSVYYNPEKPHEAVLQQAAHRTAVGLVIGIILLGISCCFLSLMVMGIIWLKSL
ncbi:MAG TPA: DUF3592 domain-containing protein [Brevefilum fermentans]|jgi:hypothetical protein|uniref:DUF3592 domain-containing protein n=1 Tax=Candidatus Brevifilum fermentans TaxID=1986204 RepID=A0A1Y6K4Y7_9CHLR|nr:DUF3592 domain-containing protein [Brevefilum fermentans]MDI9566335.1 DUF3592 domain-containing protein [Chloroflexota bacterium]OQB83141.1 MAG: hypothetical protein BWX85_01393 [Chloroflexi bacterium ADurb.Bin120]SMX53938.1 protein of unknown function [Brevefilum fermentans]HQA29700.1 DUF3592 domain-containing protein [Brevefilum fermentans]